MFWVVLQERGEKGPLIKKSMGKLRNENHGHGNRGRGVVSKVG